VAEQTMADQKLVQYLSEAYGKEKELETSLQAHIGMNTRAPYKKRLQQHLRETKNHSKLLERRIKKLSGSGPSITTTAPAQAAQVVGRVKAAAVDGPEPLSFLIRRSSSFEWFLVSRRCCWRRFL